MNTFKWCFARYLHPADHHPARNTKLTNRLFGDKLDFQ